MSSESRSAADNRLRSIDDYLSASDVFPGVGLKGGVCYFLWERNNPGPCQVTTHYKDWPVSPPAVRFLKAALTYSFVSMKACRSSRRSLLSRAGNRNRFLCLTVGVSSDWLVL